MRHVVKSILLNTEPDTLGRIHLRLLDDGSLDGGMGVRSVGQQAASADRFLSVECLRHGDNLGIVSSWNDLARSTDCEIIVLLNDDILVAPGWLDAMVYFLRNNPQAGAASWGFQFIIQDDVRVLLSEKGAGVPPRHHATKAILPGNEWEPHGHKPGRMMCPAGCCFAFTRERFEEVGGFDTRFRSFYEETDFGTRLAEMGYPCFGLTWPRLYHIWGATFAASPELRCHETMTASREAYRKKWGCGPGDAPQNDVHGRLMPKIPGFVVRWVYNDEEKAEADPPCTCGLCKPVED